MPPNQHGGYVVIDGAGRVLGHGSTYDAAAADAYDGAPRVRLASDRIVAADRDALEAALRGDRVAVVHGKLTVERRLLRG